MYVCRVTNRAICGVLSLKHYACEPQSAAEMYEQCTSQLVALHSAAITLQHSNEVNILLRPNALSAATKKTLISPVRTRIRHPISASRYPVAYTIPRTGPCHSHWRPLTRHFYSIPGHANIIYISKLHNPYKALYYDLPQSILLESLRRVDLTHAWLIHVAREFVVRHVELYINGWVLFFCSQTDNLFTECLFVWWRS